MHSNIEGERKSPSFVTSEPYHLLHHTTGWDDSLYIPTRAFRKLNEIMINHLHTCILLYFLLNDNLNFVYTILTGSSV